MLIVIEINAVTDSQIMLYLGILDGIAVYLFRTMKQWWEDEEHRNTDVHRRAVQVGLHKLRAIYVLLRSFIR